jgi:hypothetical protein
MADDTVVFLDDDGAEVALDGDEAESLWVLTEGLESSTVSACPDCRARVLASVACADLLEVAPPHPRSRELLELAADAPTLHLYVVDLLTDCRHRAWHDPGFTEWREAVVDLLDDPRRPR